MADEQEDFQVGDIVELLASDDMPWPLAAGKRGVVHYVPDPNDPNAADDPNMIVTFDDPAFPGVTTRRHHFRKVQEGE